MRIRGLLVIMTIAAGCLSTATPGHAQSLARKAGEAGRPFITNFAPSDYDADTQNWAVVEDNRGIVYVGNNSGLLEYDGTEWLLILMPNGTTARSLAEGPDGRIWVGAVRDMGYLAPDSLGRTAFVSLAHEVPEEVRGFEDVWQTTVIGEDVYFLTADVVLHWDGTTMRFVRPETSFHMAYAIRGEYYARVWNVGLMKLDRTGASETFRLLPGGEQFAATRIYVMLPFDAERILVGTREEGLFLYDGQRFEPFRTEADNLLSQGGLYLPGAVLADGYFALGTLSEGLVVIDRAGRLASQISRQTGLVGESVLFPYVDDAGTLWLALDNGIARVESASPFTRYDAATGLLGQILSLARHDGTLYALLRTGQVLLLDAAVGRLRALESPVSETNQVLSYDGDLLVAASNDGLFRVKGERLEPVRRPVAYDYLAVALHPWSRDPRMVLVGLGDGLAILRRNGSTWVDEGRVPGVDLDSWAIAEADDGTLWIGSQTGRVAHLRLPETTGMSSLRIDSVDVTMFGPEDGLPGGVITPFRVGSEIFVTTLGERVFRADHSTGRLVADHTFDGARSGHPLAQLVLREDTAGNVWIATTYGPPAIARPAAGGGYTIDTSRLQRLRRERVIDIYPEPDGIVWFMGDELVRYDPSLDTGEGASRPPLIRSVELGSGRLVYGGFGDAKPAEVAFGSDGVRFRYAAPGAQGEVRYRTRLDGFDPDWSGWSGETERVYTNLSPGDYTFSAEAEGRGVATYTISVLPPWYRTWWAFLLWVALFAGVVYSAAQAQRHRLVKKERERSALLEAELRADAADSNAKALKADNDRKQNVELLSRIGQTITSTLSVSEIIDTVYEHVNSLMDAEIFGVGIYNGLDKRIDFPATKEKGVTLPPYTNRLDDADRLGVWCFTHGKEVVIGEFAKEHPKYLAAYKPPISGEDPESVLYLPLVHQDRRVGVITTQSFKKDAYTEYHVNLLRNLATYTAIALDNASAYRTLEKTVSQLQSTQKQLVEQEKLASLGSLTAGIAHEIKNPLNFVNNFAEVNAELADELDEALARGDAAEVASLVSSLRENATQIAKHGRRADSIVRSMMQHARGGASERETIDVNVFVEEYAGLAWHGLRARDDSFKAELVRDLAPDTGTLAVLPQELGRVVLNLLSNAFQAVQEKVKKEGASAPPGGPYVPRVTIATRRTEDAVTITVADNGPGIPPGIREKIFEPFFTTKATGEGTGLGLSLSYDIVTKGHGGTMTVDSRSGGGAQFTITIPSNVDA